MDMTFSVRSSSLRIVVPAYDSVRTLQRCLEGIRRSVIDIPFEIVIVDDGENGNLANLATQFDARVIPCGLHDPGAARNLGAKDFTGDFLAFIDADVVIAETALQQLLTPMIRDTADATIGNYATAADGFSFCERYKQVYLSHLYSRRGTQNCRFFWTAFCAIKRSVFASFGGFNTNMHAHVCEDEEYGHRLSENGIRIVRIPSATGLHLKPFTFRTLIRNDLTKGSHSILLALQHRKSVTTNPHASHRDILAVLTAGLLLLFILILPLTQSLFPFAASGCCALSYMWVRREFLSVFLRQGPVFALRAVALMYVLDLVRLCCVPVGALLFLHGASPSAEEALG